MSQPEDRELTLIERYKESHHAVARMFAAGLTLKKIQQNTGYSQRRLKLLAADPTFNELITIYHKRIEEKWNENVDAYTDLAIGNLMAAERQIADKLAEADDAGELLPTRELLAIAGDRADRFGYSKHSIHHHEHDFAAALDKAISRSGIKTIEGSVVAASASPMLPSPSEEPVSVPERSVEKAQAPRPSFVTVLKKRRVA